MKILNEIINDTKKSLAVSIGCFDGVHRGHKKVISKVLHKQNEGLIPTVFTFYNNPKSIIKGEKENKIISNNEKYKILKDIGIKLVYSIDFLKVKDYSAEQFVETVLYKKLHTKYIVCGFNFTFGSKGIANATDLKKLCEIYGIEAEIIPPIIDNYRPVSSTTIRELLKEGDIENANKLLGRNFKLKSIIVSKENLYSNINKQIRNKNEELNVLFPPEGLYLSGSNINGIKYIGVTYIKDKMAQTYFRECSNNNLYGTNLYVEILSKLV